MRAACAMLAAVACRWRKSHAAGFSGGWRDRPRHDWECARPRRLRLAAVRVRNLRPCPSLLAMNSFMAVYQSGAGVVPALVVGIVAAGATLWVGQKLSIHLHTAHLAPRRRPGIRRAGHRGGLFRRPWASRGPASPPNNGARASPSWSPSWSAAKPSSTWYPRISAPRRLRSPRPRPPKPASVSPPRRDQPFLYARVSIPSPDLRAVLQWRLAFGQLRSPKIRLGLLDATPASLAARVLRVRRRAPSANRSQTRPRWSRPLHSKEKHYEQHRSLQESRRGIPR